MRRRLTYLLLFFMVCKSALMVHAQQVSNGITLLAHWNNPSLPKRDGYQIWNDITAWHDSSTGKEYVIAGSTDSIYFFDISDPTQLKLCDVRFGTSTNMVNRDYECYQHYVYCVSDNRNKGSLQVFDMRYLPDSVRLVYDSDSLSYNTHSIFIEASSKRLYLATNRLTLGGKAAMDILTLENPERPKWIGRLEVPTDADGTPYFNNVHEVYVRHDTAYCSVEYKGLWIFDLRDLKKQRLLSVISDYPESGYNHSSHLDPTGRYIMFTDEIPAGQAIKIFNISDLRNPRLVSLFRSNTGAIAHNAFWVGSFAYVSYYHDGVYVFNLSEPSKPFLAGYYHTSPWPPQNYEGYKGCWGLYPWLPSGVVPASDMGEGIFLLKMDSTLTGVKENKPMPLVEVVPNPFTDQLHFSLSPNATDAALDLYNLQGELVLHKTLTEITFETETAALPAGTYFAVIQGNNWQTVHKLIKP